MHRRPRSSNLQSAIASILIVAMSALTASLPAAVKPATTTASLSGDEKLLQVLNRFTYGPRPGDLEHIRAIGLQAWFNEQLVPQRIDESALDKRLAAYPAMQLPLKQLMERYPNQQIVRKVMNGNADRPGGEAEKAIYNDSIARYRAKQADKKAGDKSSADENPPDATPLPQDTQTLIDLPPDKRFSALCKFTPPQLKALRQAARPEERLQLVAGFTPRAA